MRRLIMPCLLAVTIAGVVWLGGVRLFMFSPNSTDPDGATAILWGVPALALVDSPQRFCAREAAGGLSTTCRFHAVEKSRHRATVLLRLPYVSWLDRLGGEPTFPAETPAGQEI